MAVEPQTVDFIERAPVRAVAEREVAAAPDRVFEVLADAASWPAWFPNLSEAAWLTDAPHGVGSRRRVRVGPLRIVEEFIVWEPGERWGFTFVDVNLGGTRAGVELLELTPTGPGRTHVRHTMAIEPRGLLKPLTGPFRAGAEKGLRRGLKGLDDYLRRTT